MLSCLFHSYIVGKLEKDARDTELKEIFRYGEQSTG